MCVLAMAGCSDGGMTPAAQSDIAELPFRFEMPVAFKAFNAHDKGIVLQASPGPSDKVVPTVEIEVDLRLASHNFSAKQFLKDHWPELADSGMISEEEPRGDFFMGKQAIVTSGTVERQGETVHVEQWVSKQDQGYTRLVAYAPVDRFSQLRGDIEAVARSLEFIEH